METKCRRDPATGQVAFCGNALDYMLASKDKVMRANLKKLVNHILEESQQAQERADKWFETWPAQRRAHSSFAAGIFKYAFDRVPPSPLRPKLVHEVIFYVFRCFARDTKRSLFTLDKDWPVLAYGLGPMFPSIAKDVDRWQVNAHRCGWRTDAGYCIITLRRQCHGCRSATTRFGYMHILP